MTKLNPKRLKAIGSLTTAAGKKFIIEQDWKSKRCAISDGANKVLQTASTESAAWRAVRYLAEVTHKTERTASAPRSNIGGRGRYAA